MLCLTNNVRHFINQTRNSIDDVQDMISPKQIKAARVFLEWEQRDLAEASGLSLPTIQRMEKLGAERSQAGNVERLQQAIEAAGIEFIPEANGGGAGLRMKAKAQ